VNEATLHAVSVLMDLAIDTGNYTISARSQFFPEVCTTATMRALLSNADAPLRSPMPGRCA
jgi:hypothetical protein